MNYTLVNATTVNPTVWVQTNSVSLSATSLNQTVLDVVDFLGSYGPESVENTVYVWMDNSGINVGVLKVSGGTIIELYYITITQ